MEQSIKKGFGTRVNGWVYTTDGIGVYGTACKHRAFIALSCHRPLGFSLVARRRPGRRGPWRQPEDAVYPVAYMDGDGQPLSRTKRYVLHFDKGELAPADAFWSVTLYDNEGLQVPNALDRFALGDGDKLTYDADGSLDFYVRADSPGTDKEPNWLSRTERRVQPDHVQVGSPLLQS